ncbi:hypothetical protein LZC95_35860 [Pendulispora brunnea]|uniref:Uncharacterized protein n=1 Tax=Pendulispora brunnea TaxID=2905690 RepID=A0ABZ2JZB5_9BACT
MSFRAGFLAIGLFLAPFVPHAAHAQESVQVHLEEPTTRLERQTPRGWELACDGACRDEIPAGTYRLRKAEDGEPIGGPFRLDAEHTPDVRVGPNRLRPILIGLGAAGMGTGGLAALIGWFIASPPHFCIDPPPNQPCEEPETNHTGTAIAVAGVVTFIAGTVLLIGGVSQPPVAVSDRRTSAPVSVSWRRPEPSRVSATPGAMTFPLLSGSF